MTWNRRTILKAAGAAALLPARAARADDMPGVTPSEIKIGNTMPYSGPASAYSVIAKAEAAFFKMVNEKGGINGRKINFISLDDGYSPPKTVEQTRKLVEQEGVAFMVQGLGTPTQSAVRTYLNAKKVPQMFVATGADKWGDYEHFPWTIGFQPSYRTEAAIYAKYILKEKPGAKIGVIYQNDDFGKDYIAGLKDALGDKYATMVVKEVSYETTDPTTDSQVVTVQSAGADVLVSAATPKAAAQVIRKVADLNWKPLHIMTNVSISVGAVLNPAGLDKATGLTSAAWQKDNTDPQWANDPGMNEWRAFMKAWLPDGDLSDNNNTYGYGASLLIMQVLKQCGDDLSRANLMKQAANIKDFSLPILLPGSVINTSPTNFHPVRSMQMQRFNGKTWELFGSLITA